jgi:hypothetical protein
MKLGLEHLKADVEDAVVENYLDNLFFFDFFFVIDIEYFISE